MTARWRTAALVQLVGVVIAGTLAVSVWSQPSGASGMAVALLVVVTAVAITSLGAVRMSLLGLAVCALAVPTLANGHRDDGLRAAASVLVWLAPGLLTFDTSLRLHGKALRPSLVVVALCVACAIAQLLFTDPFRVVDCALFCSKNPFVIDHRPAITTTVLVLTAAALGWWIVVCLKHARRRVYLVAPVTVLGAMVLLSDPWTRVLVARSTAEQSVLAVAAVMLAVIVGDGVVSDVRQILLRRRIRAASRALGTGAERGRAQTLLAEALRDPTVRIGYPLYDGRLVDVDGLELPTSHDVEPAFRLVRRDGLVAVLYAVAERDLTAALTPHLVVAIENEGLVVRSRALLDELQRSRQRLVASADETRHQLERDLHDGAQQRLLAITMLLAADQAEDGAWRRAAVEQAMTTLVELRRIARGLYPVSLDRLGLEAALRSYLDEAPVAVELEVGELLGRLSAPIERVVYRVVRTYAEQASRDGATVVSVDIQHRDDEVHVVFEHDGRSTGDTTDIEDRVGAIGGRWVAHDHAAHQNAEAVIPCG